MKKEWKKGILFALAAFIMLFVANSGSFSAPAQFSNRGALNTWTTRVVQRQHETAETAYTAYLKRVHVTRHNGFDRAVFEFQGPLPNYSFRYLDKPVPASFCITLISPIGVL